MMPKDCSNRPSAITILCFFLESELSYGDKMEIPTEEYLVPIGKARVVKKGEI